MSTSKEKTSDRKNSSEQGKTLSMFDRASNNIGEGSAAGSFAAACHGSDDNIIYNNDKIISGTVHIGGLKGSLKKIENKIKIILNNKNYESVKQLISLRKGHYKAREKCKRAIETFCSALESGSPKWESYCSQIEELKSQFNDIEEQIDKFLIAAVEIASSVRSSRNSRCLSEKKTINTNSESITSKEANVRIKLLRLEKVQQDQILNAEEAKMKAMAFEVEAKRAVLNAKLELAEAQALVEEEQFEDRSQDLSDVDAKALTAHERVIRFLEKLETDLGISGNCDSIQMVNAKGMSLRHDAPS